MRAAPAECLQRDFTAMVTHELGNPLSGIRGYAQLLQRGLASDEQAAAAIIPEATRLQRLVDELLDVSRLEASRLKLRRERLDLVRLARTMAEQAQALTPRHAVRVEAPDRSLIGRWDHDRLAQVLPNLLSNAIKYSPDGGEVLVRVEDLGQEARVSVSDRGVGIPSAELRRLLQRFSRTEAATAGRARGLGLYISRALVEAHGGRIWAVSEVGRGSTFTFTLPYMAQAEQ
jgi:signal transduction histidine kinase